MSLSQLTESDPNFNLASSGETNDLSSSVATIELPEESSAVVADGSVVANDPVCEKCQTPLLGKQGWCRRCGWYPRLGTFVELDPWDREDVPQPKSPTKLDICKNLVPMWAWQLLGGVLAVLAVSLVMRQILPQHGGYRFAWTIGQMLIGFVILCGAHLSCYLLAMMYNDRMQLLDIVLKPLAIWIAVCRELPATFWRIAAGTWGLAAIVGGLLVGGLADKDLLDWGGTPARYNLTKAIADRAQQLAADAKSDKSLEESIEDFAGKAAEPEPKEDPSQRDKPKLPVDCLILGYKPMGDRDFSALILAAELGGKLQVVGTVSEGVSSQVRALLNERFRQLRQPNPFIPCKLDGKWIRPSLVCKIKAKRWSNENRLIDPVFDEMLVDVEVQH